MPKFQVIVSKDDRNWDSIRSTQEQALFRVTEHMVKTGEEGVRQIADTAQWKLVFGQYLSAVSVLQKDGFTVTVKELV